MGSLDGIPSRLKERVHSGTISMGRKGGTGLVVIGLGSTTSRHSTQGLDRSQDRRTSRTIGGRAVAHHAAPMFEGTLPGALPILLLGRRSSWVFVCCPCQDVYS
jgi:hypothetical protein